MQNGNIENHPDKENKYFIRGYNDSKLADTEAGSV
jgi:hypothetical protein